ALLAMLAACSKNDDNVPDDPKGKIDITQSIEFKVNVKDFNAEKDVAGTRTAQKPDIISKKTVDLGNNLLAEVTVQRDTAKTQAPTTRVLDDDTYTMLVFTGSFPAYTLKARVTGTLKDGKFRPGKGVRLDPGKYIFVLHNSRLTKVTTPMGTTGLKLTRDNADKALIGQTEYTVTATPDPQYVDFEMSHVGCRMRIKLTGWMPIQASTTASLQAYNSNLLPKDCVFELPIGDMSDEGDLSGLNEPLTFPASATTPDANDTYTTQSNEYLYFVPGTDMEGFKLTFTGGQIYKKNMAGVSVNLISLVDPDIYTAHVMSINESYLVNINLKYNFLYLMSDGTTDFINSTQYTALRASDGKTKIYRDKAGNLLATPKVPIAVVLSQSKGMAIALKDANGGAAYKWNSTSQWKTQLNKDTKTKFDDLLTLENGYSETWDASASMDNTTVKGTSSDFPAFKAAGDYNPGVSVSGTMVGKKWYLPAYGEWKYVFTALCFGDANATIKYAIYLTTNSSLAKMAFTQVGGMPIAETDYSKLQYHTSSEYRDPYESDTKMAGRVDLGMDIMSWDLVSKDVKLRVRPFIRYK
ncbi:hypothetical protein, partial [Hoylesella marshii]|uniref:hypothetical protein n=1 Tax=Hoylesella marshii TaxID=189722 RepID=UPI0028D4BEDF